MKKIAIICVALLLGALCGVVPAVAQNLDAESIWERGNTLYTAGDYNGALAVYDSIQKEGLVSAKLFYNMGNANFKSGKIGEAILYYNKAQNKSIQTQTILGVGLAYTFKNK